jgi:hypothetical protein
MTTRLNKKAYDHARELVGKGRFVGDDRDAWSEDAPSADEQNAFIEGHDYAEFGLWHLGIDDDATEDTKGRYSFPYGDFSRVHRCAIIAIESRASQNDYDEIREAAGKLKGLIDD